jgi:hypothetical protein
MPPLGATVAACPARVGPRIERRAAEHPMAGMIPKHPATETDMPDELLGHRLFTDGSRRSIYRDAARNQYVLDDEGERVHGLFLIPEEGCWDLPIIVPDTGCPVHGRYVGPPVRRPAPYPVGVSGDRRTEAALTEELGVATTAAVAPALRWYEPTSRRKSKMSRSLRDDS